MLKFTTRNNNTNAATTREIYPRIIRGISIDSPRMAIGHERARLSRTKHEPSRRPKWMIYRVRRENDTKWRGQSVLPSFSRDCFFPPSPFFLLSLIVSKKEKTFHRGIRKLRKIPPASENEFKLARYIGSLIFAYSSKVVRSWITLPCPPCLLSRWQIKRWPDNSLNTMKRVSRRKSWKTNH